MISRKDSDVHRGKNVLFLSPLATSWQDFATHVIPVNAGLTQRIETRRAFYAGAQALFTILQQGVSDEEEATVQDMHLMATIYGELQRFAHDLAHGLV